MPTREPVAKLTSLERTEIERIVNSMSSLTNKIKRDFLNAVTMLGQKINAKALIELLQQGRTSVAVMLIDDAMLAAGFKPIGVSVTDSIVAVGRSAVAAMPVLRAVEFSFGITNPQTINYLRQYELRLIRSLTNSARNSIRTALVDGMQAGLNPITIARDVRRYIGLTPYQTKAVSNYRIALENQSKSALGRALRDKRFDRTVARAAAGGPELTPAQIDRMVERYQQRYLAFRAETIARTEAANAASMGNSLAWRQQIDEGLIEADAVSRHWIYTHDKKTRHAHRTIDEMNPDGVGIDEPFESELGPIMHPGDPNAAAANSINCRCATFIRLNHKGKRS